MIWRRLALAALLLAAGLSGAAWYVSSIIRVALDAPLILEKPQNYLVTPGMSLQGIANDLAGRGILHYPRTLKLEGRLRGLHTKIKAGEYHLQPGLTAQEFLNLLVAGEVVQYSLILIEGWSFQRIMQAVNEETRLTHTLPDSDALTVMTALGAPALHPEGYFFPDTYYFSRGATDVDLLRRAHEKMNTVLRREWRDRNVGLPYRTAYEALIMASIVEKETAAPEERAMIAGVFVKRLLKGMKLQTDPTVIYAMGEDYQGNIRRHDLSIDSPYNTYLHPGLPPTPIASPGADAIRAALRPEIGDALYFVSTGDGRHHFSANLREHNRAVARYQKRQN